MNIIDFLFRRFRTKKANDKTIKTTPVKYDKQNRPSYEKYSDNKIATAINPTNKKVVTVRRFHTAEYNKIKQNKRKRK